MNGFSGSATPICQRTRFRGREAIRLQNSDAELVVLPGGGHIASFKLVGSDINPLWEPPWTTIEPDEYDPVQHPQYGIPEGRLLASIAGHSLCLNHFGELSEAEVTAGGYFHGEAPNLPWNVRPETVENGRTSLSYGLTLPEAGLDFQRKITIPATGAVISIDETVTNLRRSDSPLVYQQHVTAGPPFVEGGVTRVDVPATRGRTFPRSTGAADRLIPGQDFCWPLAPGRKSGVPVNLFPAETPTCSLCAVLQAPKSGLGFIVISNSRLGLMLGYLFDANLFPWTALWEENCATADRPYGCGTVAWGIEFGTTPLPVTRIENLFSGALFGKNRFGIIPARSTLHTEYQAFLHRIPQDWAGVAEIAREGTNIMVHEAGFGRQIQIGGAD